MIYSRLLSGRLRAATRGLTHCWLSKRRPNSRIEREPAVLALLYIWYTHCRDDTIFRRKQRSIVWAADHPRRHIVNHTIHVVGLEGLAIYPIFCVFLNRFRFRYLLVLVICDLCGTLSVDFEIVLVDVLCYTRF